MSDEEYNLVVDASRADDWNKECDECGRKATSLFVKIHLRGASLTEMCASCSSMLKKNNKALKIGEYDEKINIFGL